MPNRRAKANLKGSIAQKEKSLAPEKVEPDFFAVGLYESPVGACISIVDT